MNKKITARKIEGFQPSILKNCVCYNENTEKQLKKENMKIIDLLNKIANGEEVPKKIKYQNVIYIYYERLNDMFNYKSDDKRHRFLEEDYYIENILNDEVEIIEEDNNKIEKMKIDEIEDAEHLKFKEKINEIIDYLDYLKSKGE